MDCVSYILAKFCDCICEYEIEFWLFSLILLLIVIFLVGVDKLIFAFNVIKSIFLKLNVDISLFIIIVWLYGIALILNCGGLVIE
jgi:hypothetical protein